MKLVLAISLSFVFQCCHQIFPPSPDAGQTSDAGSITSDSGVVLDDGGVIDSGTPRDAGSDLDAGPIADGGADASKPASCVGPPGLFSDTDCKIISSELRSYTPKYTLWSDGATKQRYVYLPLGGKIDTTNPDRWTFPVGTRFYKTFFVGEKMIETRIIEKTIDAPGIASWTLVSYAWSDDQKSASLADPNGVVNALGTTHDIPSQAQCKQCHTMPNLDAVNGFGAIQLNNDDTATSLTSLLSELAFTDPSNIQPQSATIPGDQSQQDALGYLHVNCGHCHGGPAPKAGQSLWVTVGATDATLPVMTSAVCRCLTGWTGHTSTDGSPYVLRISPGHSELSGVIARDSSRGTKDQMPPVGTKIVDLAGVNTVSAWIDGLDATTCTQTCAN